MNLVRTWHNLIIWWKIDTSVPDRIKVQYNRGAIQHTFKVWEFKFRYCRIVQSFKLRRWNSFAFFTVFLVRSSLSWMSGVVWSYVCKACELCPGTFFFFFSISVIPCNRETNWSEHRTRSKQSVIETGNWASSAFSWCSTCDQLLTDILHILII